MRLYYQDHSVNAVQRNIWCSVRESSEIKEHIIWKVCWFVEC